MQTGLEKTIKAADLHETDYTPWEDHVVTAWPTVTIKGAPSLSRTARSMVSSNMGSL